MLSCWSECAWCHLNSPRCFPPDWFPLLNLFTGLRPVAGTLGKQSQRLFVTSFFPVECLNPSVLRYGVGCGYGGGSHGGDRKNRSSPSMLNKSTDSKYDFYELTDYLAYGIMLINFKSSILYPKLK